MKRLEHLIYEVRESTDHEGPNSGISDNEITGYFNDGQSTIQALIFKNNSKADLFRGSKEYAYDFSGEYQLPEDIYAVNAIYGVQVYTGAQWVKINRIEQDAPGLGYWTEDGKILITGYTNQKVKINYFKKLPKLSKRVGKVMSKSSVTVILEAGFDPSIGTISDYITVVDKDGNFKTNLYVSSISPSGVIQTSDATTLVSIGDYILNERNSTNVVTLMEASWTYWKDYVRQRIYGRQNYNDAGKQDYFTTAQKNEIISLFANNQKDDLAPPQYDIDLDLDL